jgi:hypothetical protein
VHMHMINGKIEVSGLTTRRFEVFMAKKIYIVVIWYYGSV